MTVAKNEEKQLKEKCINTENKITNAVSILQNSLILSDTEKEAVTTLGESVTSMANELKVIKDVLICNMVLQAEFTQRLIANANRLHVRISNHCNAKMLTDLSELLIQGLRTYCDDLLPLASGYYKPHHENTLKMEGAEGVVNVLELLAHNFSTFHVIPQYLHPVGHLLPILSIAIKAYEVYKDHRLIHQAYLVKPIKGYSDNERTAIYKSVINSALLAMATRIGDGKPIGHRAETKHLRNSGSLLQRWYTLIMIESIFALGSLGKADNIELLASNWEKVLLQKFYKKDKKMNSSKEIQNQFFEENQITIALRVQTIFTAPTDLSNYPDLPEIRNFCDDFHRKIYDFVLRPYKRRTEEPYIAAFFCGYGPDDYDNLRDFQIRFSKALELLSLDMYPLIRKARSANLQLQLNLINSCLYGNLHKMLDTLKWHKPANDLLLEELPSDYGIIKEPLALQEKTGKYQIISPLIDANGQIRELEDDLIRAKGREDKAKFEATEARSEAAVARSEAAVANLKVAETQAQLEKALIIIQELEAKAKIQDQPYDRCESKINQEKSPKEDEIPISKSTKNEIPTPLQTSGLFAEKNPSNQQTPQNLNTTTATSTSCNQNI